MIFIKNKMSFDPIDNPLNYKWGIFYFNRDDSRLIVPKKLRHLGWTLNFAHKTSYLLLIAFY